MEYLSLFLTHTIHTHTLTRGVDQHYTFVNEV